jgi:hypothetical protein
MTTADYILGLSALALIVWNMRRHVLTNRRLLRPIVIAAAICLSFLHGIPLDGGDGVLVVLGVLVGLACGALSALATRIERDAAGRVVAAGTPLAVGLTVVVFAGRMGFAVAATHGLGPAIARFSGDVGIHSQEAWVASLVLMAAADLAVRALILWQRRAALAGSSPHWTARLRGA